MASTILEMKNITKVFPGVIALDEVNIRVASGEIHALVGENGAGKSTLMKVLSGVYPHGTYTGDILFQDQVVEFKDINHSEHLGIVIIHQELALIPHLSIAENIFLGNERARLGIIDWNKTTVRTRELLTKVGLTESPNALISSIGVGKQQLVEIAKALSKEVKLLILDEPTAALNERDSDNLLQLLLELKNQGITSILITHKLNEIAKVADTITILRDGKTIETLDVKKDGITEDRIIKGMVGRDMTHRFPARTPAIGPVIFEVKDWNVFHPEHAGRQVIHNAHLTIRQGEVVGIAGLMGSGRTEFALSVFGKAWGKHITGSVIKDGKELNLTSVSQAIAEGIAYSTEDRKQLGLILIDDIQHNTTLASLGKVSNGWVLNDNLEIVEAERLRASMNTKCSSIRQKTVNLSGGNQQKVVLSKWIFSEPDILILDEPTRGIDVGAKYEIYTIINRLASEGKGVLLISSELPEILGLCDRIYVMSQGRFTGELERAEANQEKIMKYMLQGKGN
jgi:putative multiple sugar transport system ATP-binding protein